MQTKSLLNNEDGSVIVLALIFLVLLTVLGMSATSTSTIEVQIAGNGARVKKNLYMAEAAAMEAVQLMENGSGDNLTLNSGSAFSWLIDQNDPALASPDISNPITEIPQAKHQASTTSDPVTGGNPIYTAVSRGITGATSLKMTTASQLYTFDVYGIHAGDGLSQMVVGYKKRL